MERSRTKMRIKVAVFFAALLFCSRGFPLSALGNHDHFDPSYSPWNQVLKSYVHHARVNYAELKAHPRIFKLALSALAQASPVRYEKWPREDKIAFWINAYNASTVQAIVDHYPIQSSWALSLIDPKNSIRQIPGVWDKLKFHVLGKELTLGAIENAILRKEFHEPRIHMAIVCASKGCPPLRSKAYTGARLNHQLNDQARRFLSDPKKFRIDREGGVVYLSPIFEWFGRDFVKNDEAKNGFGARSTNERAVLNFISRYVSVRDADYLKAGNFQIRYLGYNWSLNQQ